MRTGWIAFVAVAACKAAAPEVPPPEAPAPVAPAPAPDAGIDPALASAPAWIFQYRTADRDETWTLRFTGGEGLMDVETKAGVTRYVGTATEGDALVLELRAPTATISLRCERTERAIGAACNDAKAAPIEVLDCYHPDFETPMPFGAAPGVEYVVDATCDGYRLVP